MDTFKYHCEWCSYELKMPYKITTGSTQCRLCGRKLIEVKREDIMEEEDEGRKQTERKEWPEERKSTERKWIPR